MWIEYIGFPEDHFKFSPLTWLFILTWVTLPTLAYCYSHFVYIQRVYKRRSNTPLSVLSNEVVVIVLGDLGHSPRMSYHAKSFAKLGYHVNLCGYLESTLPEFLLTPDISIYDIPVTKNQRGLPYLIFAALKIVSQIWDLTKLLVNIVDDSTRFVVLQNPPSLPVLLIIGLLKNFWAPQVQIVIDWHNLNWSILNLKYQNENHPVVRLMKFYEKYCSQKFADFNLTVTKALKNYLIEEFGLRDDKIMTLYDRPSEIFSPLESQEELKSIVKRNQKLFEGVGYDQEADRVLITSTSFTADEDFAVLVHALMDLDAKIAKTNTTHRVLMIVTGKGPLQNEFLNSIRNHEWKNITIKNVWLPIQEYPNVLKIADLGISLHYSSSGLDLPMKIVDLFGSGVPVLTMNYPVIRELVRDGVNGVIVNNNADSTGMSTLIYDILFSTDQSRYLKIKEGALLESSVRWGDEWDAKLAPLMALNVTKRL